MNKEHQKQALIEMMQQDEKDGISRPVMDDGALKDYKGDWEYSPKVTSNNEIIIHSIEEKMYSKDEVVQLFRDYQNAKAKQILDGSEPIIPLEWIKENLN